MRRVFSLNALVLVLFLVGCTTTTWYKNGVTPTQGRNDIASCAGDAGIKPVDSFSVKTFTDRKIWVYIPVFSEIDYDEYKKCMKGKGYRLGKKGSGKSAAVRPAQPRTGRISRTARSHSLPHPFRIISSADHRRSGDPGGQLGMGGQTLDLDGRHRPVIAGMLLP